MNFIDLLKLMKHKKASDLFVTAGVPPSIKVDGKIMPVTKQALTPEQSRARWLQATVQSLLPAIGATIAFNSSRRFK